MALGKKVADYYPRRINAYVPAAKYAGEVSEGGVYRVTMGSPAATSSTTALNAFVITSTTFAYETDMVNDGEADAVYGRNVQIVLGGAGTAAATIWGRDYLGQPMYETITANGATPVVGVKCFKWIDKVGYAGSATISVGWSTTIGLPFKTNKILADERAGVPATLGTLTAPVLTDPQTATTGEPRGRYAPNAAFNGTEIILTCIADNWANASGNGGLYGIKHYYA